MCTQYLQRAFGVLALMLAVHAHGQPGESIVLDPFTGNYVVTYLGYDESTQKRTALRVVTFEPATKIEPTVHTIFKIESGGVVAYQFEIQNGSLSRQSMVMILIDPVRSLVSSGQLMQLGVNLQSNATAENYGIASYPLNTPSGWIGRATESRLGGMRLSWSSRKASLPIGAKRNGFGFFSQDLPSIGLAQLRGNSVITAWPDEGPIGEVADQLDKLVKNDFVLRNIAVPAITIPVPFDPAIVLDNLRTHFATWTGKQLVDAAFAAQLDRYLSAAADAYRLNNTKVGKEHLETIHELLEKEHKHLDSDEDEASDKDELKPTTRLNIDRLAARVLDFDLRYVLKRMERDEVESKK